MLAVFFDVHAEIMATRYIRMFVRVKCCWAACQGIKMMHRELFAIATREGGMTLAADQ